MICERLFWGLALLVLGFVIRGIDYHFIIHRKGQVFYSLVASTSAYHAQDIVILSSLELYFTLGL